MKKILASAVIATMTVFSLVASATVITFDSLEQTGTNYQWLLVGLGLLCFMELRREEKAT
jgi:ABC-type microcin C transport system permease subunit YejE